MPELIRLVIWDLDDTFWQGTLSEGGIRYKDDNHRIVVELAKRGIVSSICSKNDFASVKAILLEMGLWDYFVFPSIAWEAKGTRVKEIIASIQLRPETVMFLDDNPMNLREAKYLLPEIQCGSEELIPLLLSDSRFAGKDDVKMTRLTQYKLLEKRQAGRLITISNLDFLRASNIKLAIEHDIECNLDRAIELVNRTNQLNFTKRRLSENVEAAKSELKSLGSRLIMSTRQWWRRDAPMLQKRTPVCHSALQFS